MDANLNRFVWVGHFRRGGSSKSIKTAGGCGFPLLGLGAFGLFGGLGVGVLAFLRSAIWAHRKIVEHFGAGTNFLCDPFE